MKSQNKVCSPFFLAYNFPEPFLWINNSEIIKMMVEFTRQGHILNLSWGLEFSFGAIIPSQENECIAGCEMTWI